MRLNGLDLNLLVALDALLEEQHVTRAGERVGLTQSATSDALARLRRHYDDELLARRGNRFELTPLAEALRERVAEAITSAGYAFGARATFDPRVQHPGVPGLRRGHRARRPPPPARPSGMSGLPRSH